MLTIFDLLRLTGIVAGIVVGGGLGLQTLGIIGLVVGVVVGAFVGGYVGSIPLYVALAINQRKFASMSSHELRERLVDYEDPFTLLELKSRGVKLDDDLSFISYLLTSNDPEKRQLGWEGINVCHPQQLETIPGYDPTAPVDECREKCQPLLDQLKG